MTMAKDVGGQTEPGAGQAQLGAYPRKGRQDDVCRQGTRSSEPGQQQYDVAPDVMVVGLRQTDGEARRQGRARLVETGRADAH